MESCRSARFWEKLYEPLERVECPYGSFDLIHDSTVLSIGSAAGTDNKPDIEQMLPKESRGVFIDSWFTT